MKKLIFAVMAIATLAFAGCKKEEDGFDYDKNVIYGTWEIVKYNDLKWTLEKTTATFNPDGTYYGRGYFGTGRGTYTMSGKRITCYVGGEVYLWYDIVSISGTTAVMILVDTAEITCEKR